ncbi:helix-turn-helix domain-containing protein [Dysgonomonas macrotermitis]|nr:helix-turn-helix domain-containing protein [Dysgonomonas macrotermitis]
MNTILSSISTDNASGEMGCSIIKDYIISDGKGSCKPFFLEQPTAIQGMIFMLCKGGKLSMKINSIEYTIRKYSLLTLLSGSICETIEISDDFTFEFLFYSIDFSFELNIPVNIDLLEKVSRFPVVNLAEVQFESMLDFHSFMAKHHGNEEHKFREHLAKNLLASFMTEMCNIYGEPREHKSYSDVYGRRAEIYRHFCKLLIEYIKKERTVQFYADKICICPKYLSQLIKQISGKPIMEWINGSTIIIIKSMLKTSPMSISQIADELNFPNPSFFGYYFKKHTGMTPLRYRES